VYISEQQINLFFKKVIIPINNLLYITEFGNRGSTVVKALGFKSEGRWFDSR
jgi:hypothetical protein